jgi:predicted alpha/beta-fold hydrolase
MEQYKLAITTGFYSLATGDNVMYGYSQQDQLNYSKWANVFALNPSKVSVIIGSISHGVVTMTKEQFIQFIADAENYEVTMYLQRKDIEEQISGASTIDELNNIIITF